MQIEWTKTWTHIWRRLKSSKFMPAGACAVQCRVHSWIITNAYVAAHPDTRSFPLTTKTSAKGTTTHTYYSLCVCVCVLCSLFLGVCALQSCQMPPQQDGQKFVCLFQVLRLCVYVCICICMCKCVCACILRWFYLYTNWYTLISDAPHTPPPVAIAQQ